MHLWLSYFLLPQQGWITYHIIPGIKAKLITQVIIILTSNDMLWGSYWFSRDASRGNGLELCLATGATSVLRSWQHNARLNPQSTLSITLHLKATLCSAIKLAYLLALVFSSRNLWHRPVQSLLSGCELSLCLNPFLLFKIFFKAIEQVTV